MSGPPKTRKQKRRMESLAVTTCLGCGRLTANLQKVCPKCLGPCPGRKIVAVDLTGLDTHTPDYSPRMVRVLRPFVQRCGGGCRRLCRGG